MTNKMTKREILNAMLNDSNFSANANFVAYAKHELELLDKKSESKTKSKTQIENDDLKSLILVVMELDKCYTCTMLMKELNDDRIASQQKMSALVNALVKEGKVEKIIDKKSTFFKRVA